MKMWGISMEKDKVKAKIISLVVMIAIFFLIYSAMLVRHYSADSFAYNAHPLQNNEANLALGRIGDYFVNKIIVMFGGNYVRNQFIFVFILIMTMAVVSEKIYCHYLKCADEELQLSQKIVLKLSIILMFANVFVMEWYIFVEMTFIWSLSLIFMALAVGQIQKGFSVKKMILSIIFLMVSVSFYQATIGYYIFFSLMAVYIMNRGRLGKNAFIDSIKVIVCGGFGGGINLLLIRILQIMGIAQTTGRTENITLPMLFENMCVVWNNILTWVITTRGLLPKYTVLISIVLISIVLLWVIIVEKGKIKNIVYIGLLVVVCNGMVYFPHLMTSTVWMAQRTIASFFVIITIPAIVIAVKANNRICRYMCGGIIGIVLVLNVWKIQDISANVIASNRIDEEVAYMIQDKISQYENESGVEIKKISICKDKYTTWGNKSVEYVCMDTNLRVFNVSHSGVACINYYNNTSYETADISSEIYKQYFENKDWNILNLKEQLVFEGDTAYLVSY